MKVECPLCGGTGRNLTTNCMLCGGAGCFHCGYKGAHYSKCIGCHGTGSTSKPVRNQPSSAKKHSNGSSISWILGIIFLFIIFGGHKKNNPPQPNPVPQENPAPSLNTPIPKSDQNNTKAPNRLENQQPNSIFNNPSNSFSLFGKEFIKPADKSVSQPAPKMLRVLPPEAHLRLEPDLKSLSLGTVAQGALVTVLGYAKNAETDKQWTRVQAANGVIGFIRSSLLEDQENPTTPSSDFPDDLMVIAQEANVRSAPDPNSPSLGILAEGTPVTVLGYTKNARTGKEWTKVEMEDGTIGFIRSSLLENLP